MTRLRWMIPALLLVALVWAPGAQAVVSGSAVPITNHPYQARVVMAAPSGTYSCGGVIYDSTHVVTAGHCAYINGVLLAPSKVAVGYGSANRTMLTGAGVSEVTIPAKYLDDDTYDVALFTLAAPLAGFPSASVNKIPLASAATLATGTGGELNAFATGWGDTTYHGSSPNLLQGVPLPLRADSICSVFPYYVDAYSDARGVCAGGKAAGPNAPDTCQGDSGGPLALDTGGGYELVGLTSNGYKCGEPFTPGIYTEVSDPEIKAVIDGSAPAASTLRGSESAPPSTGGGGGTGAPAVTIPPSQAPPPPAPGAVPATRDTTRPTAKLSKVSCTKKRRCTFKLAASDSGGTVVKLAATVSRKVRACRRHGTYRYCNTNTRKKALKGRRVTGGFAFTGTLTKATYKLTAVATDAAGNRSTSLTKTFRVR